MVIIAALNLHCMLLLVSCHLLGNWSQSCIDMYSTFASRPPQAVVNPFVAILMLLSQYCVHARPLAHSLRIIGVYDKIAVNNIRCFGFCIHAVLFDCLAANNNPVGCAMCNLSFCT